MLKCLWAHRVVECQFLCDSTIAVRFPTSNAGTIERVPCTFIAVNRRGSLRRPYLSDELVDAD